MAEIKGITFSDLLGINSDDSCSISLINGCPLAIAGRVVYVFIS